MRVRHRILTFAYSGLVYGLIAFCAIENAAASGENLRQFFLADDAAPAKFDENLARIGEKLFFDKRLSRSRRMSCATCHNPEFGFEDGLPIAEGELGLPVGRHTQTLWNVGQNLEFFRDGRVSGLLEQIRIPIENPREMNIPLDDVVIRLSSDAMYQSEFKRLYKRLIDDKDLILAALASYVQSLDRPVSRFSRWLDGETELTGGELEGAEIFTRRAGCINCHAGVRTSDAKYHAIGLRTDDPGRFAVTGNPEDRFAFKTPTLTDIARRAPYLHNGTARDLKSAILSHKLQEIQTLTEENIKSLIDFLQVFTVQSRQTFE